MYIPKHLKFVRSKNKGRTLVANRAIKGGKIVLPFKFDSVKKLSESSPEAVQIDDNKFLDSKYYYVSDYINHSCEPSTKIDFKARIL